MFSWITPAKIKVKVYDYNATEEEDSYILDNAVHLPLTILAHVYNKNTSYIAHLYPNSSDKMNFKKIIYPVIFTNTLDDNVILEAYPISKYLGHYRNSIQDIELKKCDTKNYQPANKITFQIISLIPHCNEALRINRQRLIQTIHEYFSSLAFPLCLGQILVVPYSKEIENPTYAKYSFSKPKMFTPKFKLKITSINGNVSNTEEPVIYQLNEKAMITLDKAPNTKQITLLSNHAEQQWIEECERNKNNYESRNTTSNKYKSFQQSLPKLEPLPTEIIQDLKSYSCESQHQFSQLSFDFTRCGIGGYKEALRELVSQVFYSRALGQYAKSYDAKPVKGVLLYGPPGTGKTSIARAIASFFPNSQVKYVNGPELINKWVGESESALRNLFLDAQLAWQLYKENSPLYVIIFDEIDATFPKRGTRSGGTGVDDKMTSQMLTLMDGITTIGNILVIGTTNRPELLDDALKRENRFSLSLEIGLPDTDTRKEILELKTQILCSAHLLEEGINFQDWAERTAGFSGADLEQFVRMAENYAQARNFDYENETNTLKLKECVIENHILEVVKKTDFEQAYLNIKPSNRINKIEFDFNQENFVIYSIELQSIVDNYQLCINQLNSPYSNRTSYMLTGKTGTGKSDLAKYLAETSNFDSIKLVTPEQFLGKSTQVQLEILEDFFRQAKHINKCIIILDNLEGILSASGDHLRKENALVLKLISLMNRHQSNTKCMVIATTQETRLINNIGLIFDETHELSSICLSPNDFLPLKLLANSLNIKLLSTIVEDNNYIKLTIKQTLYLLRKLVNEEGCVDTISFFKLAKNMLTTNKLINDMQNDEAIKSAYQSLFSMKK